MVVQYRAQLLNHGTSAPGLVHLNGHWQGVVVTDVQQPHVGGGHLDGLVAFTQPPPDLEDRVGGEQWFDALVDPGETRHIEGGIQILDGHRRPDVTILGGTTHDLGHHADDGHRALPWTILRHQTRQRDIPLRLEDRFHPAQRMVGDVEAEHLTLEGEFRASFPVLFRHHPLDTQFGWCVGGAHAEQVVLTVGLVAFELGGGVDGLLVDRHETAPGMTHRVEGTSLDERLDESLVAHPQRHSVEELEEVLGRAVFLASGDDVVDGAGPDVADGPQAESDVLTDGRELQGGRVDVGWQHLDVLGAHVGEVQRHLVLVVTHTGEQGGTVLGWIVGLEVGRPVRDESVACGVGLVEGVSGERDHDVPQGLDGVVGVAVLAHACLEGDEVLLQDVLLLLAHGATQQVGAAQGVAGKFASDRHDLLLVHDEVVRRSEDLVEVLLELWMDGDDRLAAVLALGIEDVRIGTHRARPVQGQYGDDVVESGRPHETQQGAHGGAVELEDAERVATREHVVGVLVIEGDGVEVDLLAPVLLDDLETVIHDAEVAQAQEVHLHEPHLLELGVGEPGDDHAVLVAAVHRHEVEQWCTGQDECARVHTGATDQSLQATGGLDDLGHVRVVGDELAELGALGVARVLGIEDLAQRHPLAHDVGWHGLGDLVAQGEGVAEDTVGVLDGGLRLDLAESVDLAGVLGAVLSGDVVDDLVALTVVEVEVDVGRVDSLGVEESLEQQPVLQRVHLDDAGEVSDHRTGGRSSSRPHWHPHGTGRVADVGDDEEVRREPQWFDDRQLLVNAVQHLLRRIGPVLLVQSLGDLLAQPGLLGLPLRHVELRHAVDVGEDVVVALDHLGEGQRVVGGLRHVREQ